MGMLIRIWALENMRMFMRIKILSTINPLLHIGHNNVRMAKISILNIRSYNQKKKKNPMSVASVNQ